jgi:hypothetical protein
MTPTTKKSKKYTWIVNYTKFIGGNSQIIVKAKNEKEAISTAKNLRFTGSNFHSPTKI